MTLIRSEQQAVLNDLNAALQEAADYYREAAGSLADRDLADELRAIAADREALAEQLRTAVINLGDLPRAPDTDRETLHSFLEKLRVALATDSTHRILEQRLHSEHHLAHLVEACRAASLDRTSTALVDEVAAHVRQASDRLQALLDAEERSDSR